MKIEPDELRTFTKMPRKKPQKTIEELERQIAQLTAELTLVRQRSDSIWFNIFTVFMDEGNSEDTSEYYADKFTNILLNWSKEQRDRLSKIVATTGTMPPYSQCLNDLIVGLTPPGKEPEVLREVPVPEEEDILDLPEVRTPKVEKVLSPSESLSDDAKIGPPKMMPVNVPKGIPGAVPIGLS